MATKTPKTVKVMSSTKAATKKALLETAAHLGMDVENAEGFEFVREQLENLVQHAGPVSLMCRDSKSGPIWNAAYKVGPRDVRVDKLALYPTPAAIVAMAIDQGHIEDLTAAAALRWNLTIDGDGPWPLKVIVAANDSGASILGWLPTVLEECRKVGDSVTLDFGAGGTTTFTRVKAD